MRLHRILPVLLSALGTAFEAGAGDVTAVVANGSLKLTGSADADILALDDDALDGDRVRVKPGAGTTVNGLAGAQVFDKVKKDVVAALLAGDDQLSVDDLSVPRDLKIFGGDGGDFIEVFDGSTDDDLTINAGAGDDVVEISGEDVGDDLKVELGEALVEGNELLVEDLRCDDRVLVYGGSGADRVLLDHFPEVGDSVRLKLGDGANELEARHIGAPVDFSYKGGDDGDAVDLFDIGVGRDVALRLKDGDNAVDAEGIGVQRDVRITAGRDDDEIDWFATDVGDDLVVALGDGDNDVEIENAGIQDVLFVEGESDRDSVRLSHLFAFDLAVFPGADDNFVRIGPDILVFDAFVQAGGGEDEVEVFAFQSDADLEIRLGSGDNRIDLTVVLVGSDLTLITSNGDDVITSFDLFVLGFVDLFTGAGDDFVN